MSQEKDEAFFRNFYFVLAALIVVAIVAIFGASHIYQRFVRSQQSEADIASYIRPVGEVNVSGAAMTVAAAPAEAAPAAEAEATPSSPGEAAYRRICFSCHDQGIAGAPKTGDPAAWAARTPKGLDALKASVINGLTTDAGVMPARGGLPDLSDADIDAAVNYMLGKLPAADGA